MMKDKWCNDKADEFQPFADKHDMKGFFASLQEVYRPKSRTSVFIKILDGNILPCDHNHILAQRREYFTSLNRPSTLEEAILD